MRSRGGERLGDAKVSGNSRDGEKMLPGTRRFENTGVDDILNEGTEGWKGCRR